MHPSNISPALRTGFTTGTCATAGTKAALIALLGGYWQAKITLTLPKGHRITLDLHAHNKGENWAEAAICKDAGDDPDVTHGAIIWARVEFGQKGTGIIFRQGKGVGIITRKGLPIPVGEPAINPIPRQMMQNITQDIAKKFTKDADFIITISVENGTELAKRTWNPRLGIKGGISILGTTGIVRPFSCAAWIASIHRGIDVARAEKLDHIAGSTGSTSEHTIQNHLKLPLHGLIDMGDFVGGMLKYLCRHPIPHVTIAGGIGKITKLAQGAQDLHSKRSQVDFETLSKLAGGCKDVANANTAAEAFELAGDILAPQIASKAAKTAAQTVHKANIMVDVYIIDRKGNILAKSNP